MFDKINDLLNKARSMHNDSAVLAIDKKENTDRIVELNTIDQLFNKGVDSDGVPLEEIGGSYKYWTRQYKKEMGQPTDRVTLRDHGDFYASENAEFTSDGDVILTADTIKGGKDLQDRWGKRIIGLTTESKKKLKPKLVNDIIKYIREFL